MMAIITCVIIGAVLKTASSVVLPFTIAVLLAFVMYPLVKGLDKIRCPRFFSILLAVLIIVAGLWVFSFVIFSSGRMIIEQYPQYEQRFNAILEWAAGLVELSIDEELTFLQNLWGQQIIRSFILDVTISFSNNIFGFVANAVLVILLVVFLLIESNYIKEKLETAFGNRSDRVNKISRDMMHQVSRYLTAKFFISLATGLLIGGGLHLIGLEFAILWGVLVFLLNFIPNLGTIIGCVSISLFAILQFWPNPVPIILVLAVVLSINIIIGNFLDPKIVGEHVGLSPLSVLVSLVLWGWIWGFVGMVLAVPMMSIVKIVCENIPVLEPISVLLGSKKAVRAKKEEYEKAEAEQAGTK